MQRFTQIVTESSEPDQKVAFLSLGCPKATVDSEAIVTELLGQGYDVVDADSASEVLVINTCGFIDSARDESFEAIAQGIAQGRKVIATGCLGAERDLLQAEFPQLEFISGPAEVRPVVDAVRTYQPARGNPPHTPANAELGLGGSEARTRLTPPHYAYIKISEGCNHKCSFCIIPGMRGKLRSRPLLDIVAEAERAVADGAQELLLIAQDLSAYGLDLRYEEVTLNGRTVQSNLYELAAAVGAIAPWVRLHYVYPYPHVDQVIPLMAAGSVLPYLDIPLQHASPPVLRAMRRPAAAEKTLERLQRWREICPELGIRSTFIVGFPGETDEDVGTLLDFLAEAELDRVGCFTYSAVRGAAANALPDAVDERDKLDRQEAVYEVQAAVSARRLQRHVGQRLRVLVDHVEGAEAFGRSMYDAPDIDGQVHLRDAAGVRAGEFAWVDISAADEHDLYGDVIGTGLQLV